MECSAAGNLTRRTPICTSKLRLQSCCLLHFYCSEVTLMKAFCHFATQILSFVSQYFHLAATDEVGGLSNSYVQPYSCYELACVLLNSPEVHLFLCILWSVLPSELVEESHDPRLHFLLFSSRLLGRDKC